MIKSESYSLTLDFREIAKLEEHLESCTLCLENYANGASYAASAHGVTIYCVSGEQAQRIWNAVLEATEDEDPEQR